MINLLSLVSGNSSPLGLPGGAAPSAQSERSFAELVSAPPAQVPAKLPFPAGRQTALATIFEHAQSFARTGPVASDAGPILDADALPLDADALPLDPEATPVKIPGLDTALPATASADRLIALQSAIDVPVEAGEVVPAEAVLVTGGEQGPDAESIIAPASEVKAEVKAKAAPAAAAPAPALAPAASVPAAEPIKTNEPAPETTDQPDIPVETKSVPQPVGERAQPSTDQPLDPVATETPPADLPDSEPETVPKEAAAPELRDANEALPAFGIVLPSQSPAARVAVQADGDSEPAEKSTGDSPSSPVAKNERHQSADPTALRSSLAKAPDNGGGGASDFAQLLQGNGADTAAPAPATDDGAGASEMLAQFRADPAKSPAEIVRPTGAAPETISARPGEIGRQLGVEIVRQNLDGRDSLTIRLDPVEMGEIQVRLQFDDKGTIRAHVSAESSVALEMLRRDSGDLVRALGDAGVRTDAQSFQFEARSQGRGDQQGQHNRPEMAARQDAGHAESEAENDNQSPRPKLRSSGSLDLFA